MCYHDFRYFPIKWSYGGYGQYAHSNTRVRPRTLQEVQFEHLIKSLKNSSPDLKADFSTDAKNVMKSTIHKCVVNVIAVTTSTQYTELSKCMVKSKSSIFFGSIDFSFFFLLRITTVLAHRSWRDALISWQVTSAIGTGRWGLASRDTTYSPQEGPPQGNRQGNIMHYIGSRVIPIAYIHQY